MPIESTAPHSPADERQPWFPLTTSGSVTLLLGAACLIALLLQGLVAVPQRAFVQGALSSLVIAALIGLDWALARWYGERPPPRIALGAVALHALLVEALTLIDGLTYTSIIYLTLPFSAFFLLGKRGGIALSLGLLGWFTLKFMLLKPGWMRDPATMNTYLLFLISLALITAIAQVVQRERVNRQRVEGLLRELEVSHGQLAESHMRLARYAEQVAELATLEERNRLARDIHDSLGHYLTVIGVQLEKAIIIHSDSPREMLTAVQNSKRMADQALTDVRQSVSTLRHGQAPFRLRQVLEDLTINLRDLHLQVDLAVSGDEQRFSRQQLLTLYRAAQEGLTNVQKHAQAQSVQIIVELGELEATLTLEDDGVGFLDEAHPAARSFGLRGLQERIALMGGRLSVVSALGTGTRLTVTIPQVSHSSGTIRTPGTLAKL